VGERRKRFTELDNRPEHQSFSFLAVVAERRFRIGEVGQPHAKRVEVVGCRDLRVPTGGPVGAIVPVERGGNYQRSSSNAGHQPEPASTTFQFSGNTTFSYCCYIKKFDNLSYVKLVVHCNETRTTRALVRLGLKTLVRTDGQP
jgi:hypothetical protein